MKPGFYVMQLSPTSNTDEPVIWALVEWSEKDTLLVRRARWAMTTFQKSGNWWTLEAGPAPRRILAFENPSKGLEALIDKVGLSDAAIVGVSKTRFERLFAEKNTDGVYKLSCPHLEIADNAVYVSGFGKYSGQKFSSGNLED